MDYRDVNAAIEKNLNVKLFVVQKRIGMVDMLFVECSDMVTLLCFAIRMAFVLLLLC